MFLTTKVLVSIVHEKPKRFVLFFFFLDNAPIYQTSGFQFEQRSAEKKCAKHNNKRTTSVLVLPPVPETKHARVCCVTRVFDNLWSPYLYIWVHNAPYPYPNTNKFPHFIILKISEKISSCSEQWPQWEGTWQLLCCFLT